MDDPLSPSQDRPSRYLIESDSSDEEGYGDGDGDDYHPSRAKPSAAPYETVLSLSIPSSSRVASVTLGVGQAGKYLLRRAGLEGNRAAIELKSGEEVIGRGGLIDGHAIIGVYGDVGLEQVHQVAGQLVEGLSSAESWTVISSYLPSMYIPDRPLTSSSAPIRYLTTANGSSTSASSLLSDSPGVYEKITSPNYVTGLEAAVLTRLVHSPPKGDSTLLLLPLPLSSIPPKTFSSLLAHLPFSPRSAAAWTEADDEPYSELGMGKKQSGRTRTANLGADIGGMYM